MNTLNIDTPDPIYKQVERFIRNQILNGQLKHGERLPSTNELAKRWHVDQSTIQKAMSRLVKDRLLIRKQRRGTLVNSKTRPPLVGVLVGADLLDKDADFYRQFISEIRLEITKRNWEWRIYDHLTHAEALLFDKCMRKLLDDIRNYAFQGLIWVGFPSDIVTDTVIKTALPKVMFGATEGTGIVDVDLRGYLHAAIAYLAGQNRKRIVYLRSHHIVPNFKRDMEGVYEAAAEYRVEIKPDSICAIEGLTSSKSDSERLGYQQTVKLISAWRSAPCAPNGLIVADDVVMLGVARALRESGISVPEDLMVICMTNEGLDREYAVPVVRFELSFVETAKAIVALLERQLLSFEINDAPVLIPVLRKQSGAESAGGV
ncbi:MAG: GntR family transcriptional regulator [Verrucomicrobia bacterium]|nr:GntR family transcriptional regulator [Verrucomicrobiota bacterium]